MFVNFSQFVNDLFNIWPAFNHNSTVVGSLFPAQAFGGLCAAGLAPDAISYGTLLKAPLSLRPGFWKVLEGP